eukprot:478-Rhodomonas_salina.2
MEGVVRSNGRSVSSIEGRGRETHISAGKRGQEEDGGREKGGRRAAGGWGKRRGRGQGWERRGKEGPRE